MTQTFGLFLADVGDVRQLGDAYDLIMDSLLAAGKESCLQLRGTVKVVFHGGFAAAGDNEDIGDAAGYGFLYNILNGRLVHDRQHFLRHCFGCRQNAGAQTCGRNDSFTNFHSDSSLHETWIVTIVKAIIPRFLRKKRYFTKSSRS